MRILYDDFYKIHGCAKDNCNNGCSCNTTSEKCSDLANTLSHEISDCNNCVLDHTGLAQVYVPFQENFEIMEGCCSLMYGTVFPCLVQPYERKRNCCKKEGNRNDR